MYSNRALSVQLWLERPSEGHRSMDTQIFKFEKTIGGRTTTSAKSSVSHTRVGFGIGFGHFILCIEPTVFAGHNGSMWSDSNFIGSGDWPYAPSTHSPPIARNATRRLVRTCGGWLKPRILFIRFSYQRYCSFEHSRYLQSKYISYWNVWGWNCMQKNTNFICHSSLEYGSIAFRFFNKCGILFDEFFKMSLLTVDFINSWNIAKNYSVCIWYRNCDLDCFGSISIFYYIYSKILYIFNDVLWVFTTYVVDGRWSLIVGTDFVNNDSKLRKMSVIFIFGLYFLRVYELAMTATPNFGP